MVKEIGCWVGYLVNLPAAIGSGLSFAGVHETAAFYLSLSSFIMQILSFLCIMPIGRPDDPVVAFVNCNRVIGLGFAIFSFVQVTISFRHHHGVNYLQVNQVALTQFDLNTSSSTLNYSLEVSLGPKHGKIGQVYYQDLEAWAHYQGHNNFTSSLSTPLSPGSEEKNGSYYNSSSGTIHLVFQGQHELVLTGDALKRYQQDAAAGRFSISLTLSYSGFIRTDKSSSAAINDTANNATHSKMIKGVVTFELKHLALPDASSGWVKGDPIRGQMIGYIAGISVSGFLILFILGRFLFVVVGIRKDPLRGFTCFFIIPLIIVAICVPGLVRALRKVDEVKFTASNPSLTHFDYLSSSSTLVYNLSLAVTVGPNHRETGVYYDKVEATAYYQDQNLTSLDLSPFYLQGRLRNGSKTVILRPVFQGQQVLTMLAGVEDKYREETKARRYGIVVRLLYSGIRTDYINSSVGNLTSNNKAAHHKQLNGVATFRLKVPLMTGETVSDTNSAAANVYGFSRGQHGDFNLLLLASLIYVSSICFE